MMDSRMIWRSTLAAMAFLVASARGELSVPPLIGRVVDRAGILSAAEEERLDERIQGLERATGGQMAVLTIPSLAGDSLELFSLRVAKRWRIGHKGEDNGVVLLVSKEDRKLRLEVGRGWEDKISDAQAANTIRGMELFFRRQEYAKGVEFAIGDVRRLVTGEQAGGSGASPSTTGRDAAVAVIGGHSLSRKELAARDAARKTRRLLLVMAIFSGGALLIFLFAWVFPGSGRCCYCGSGTRSIAPRGSLGGGSGTGSAANYGRLVAGSGAASGTSGGGAGGGGFSGGGGSFGGGGASGGW